jgi:hypothetical protein
MSVISGYRIIVYEEYEPSFGVFGKVAQPSRKLYDGEFEKKSDLAKIVTLVETLTPAVPSPNIKGK